MGDLASSSTTVIGLLAQRLRAPVATAFVTVVTASAGYVVIEDWAWFDAVYMSIITVSYTHLSSCSTVTLKPVVSSVCTTTGTPPASVMASG